jgi:membrane-bound metal-dependent hydrolase YbcI (DUF457 family)
MLNFTPNATPKILVVPFILKKICVETLQVISFSYFASVSLLFTNYLYLLVVADYMTHPLLHFLIPVAVLLLMRFDRKLVLLLSPLALLPDYDFYLPPHRGFGHSIFFGAIVILIAYVAIEGMGKVKLIKAFNPNHILIVAIVMFMSHLILDGQVGWLYPLSDSSFGFRYDLRQFVWDGSVWDHMTEFPTTYQLAQVSAILITAVAIFFWPSHTRPIRIHSR